MQSRFLTRSEENWLCSGGSERYIRIGWNAESMTKDPRLFLWYSAGSASANLCPLSSLLRTELTGLLATIQY